MLSPFVVSSSESMRRRPRKRFVRRPKEPRHSLQRTHASQPHLSSTASRNTKSAYLEAQIDAERAECERTLANPEREVGKIAEMKSFLRLSAIILRKKQGISRLIAADDGTVVPVSMSIRSRGNTHHHHINPQSLTGESNLRLRKLARCHVMCYPSRCPIVTLTSGDLPLRGWRRSSIFTGRGASGAPRRLAPYTKPNIGYIQCHEEKNPLNFFFLSECMINASHGPH